MVTSETLIAGEPLLIQYKKYVKESEGVKTSLYLVHARIRKSFFFIREFFKYQNVHFVTYL